MKIEGYVNSPFSSFVVSYTKATANYSSNNNRRHSSTYLFQAQNNESPTNETVSCFPLLPPCKIDTSSSTTATTTLSSTLGDDSSQPVAFVAQAKFELQYTCNICETRNSHQVSRMAYRKGVVIAVCKGCKSKHMIADNLGWTNYKGGFEGSTNIEEYMESKGRGENIHRVSADVFTLEKSLHMQSPSETGPNIEGFT